MEAMTVSVKILDDIRQSNPPLGWINIYDAKNILYENVPWEHINELIAANIPTWISGDLLFELKFHIDLTMDSSP